MDKLRAIETFVQIVEAGSLTAAAAALGTSGPSVVRSLAALEQDVGVTLINRTTRRSSLSDEGREYYARCKRVLAELEEADAQLSARRVEPKGRLRLTAPVMFGRMHVAPLIADYMARYPAVEIELLLLDRIVDLVEEGIDAAVRIGHLAGSTLVARRMGETRRVLCATPGYLQRMGTPASPGELAGHRGILFTGLSASNEWSFGATGTDRVAIHPLLRTNQFEVALDACLRGLGCSQFLSYQVDHLLAAGDLQRILVEFEPAPLPINIVYPHARLLSSNVRAFVDLVIDHLVADPIT